MPRTAFEPMGHSDCGAGNCRSGRLLPKLTPDECANFFLQAGYVATCSSYRA
jgi:hypothetical protein